MNSKYKPGEGRRKKFAFDKGRQLDPLSLKEVEEILPLNDIRRDHLIEYLHILQDKFNALNKENEQNVSRINDLNKQIKDLDNNLLSVDQNLKDVKIKNQKFNKDNKSLIAKNLKLNETISNLKNQINEQSIEVERYLDQIKKLKDRFLHGG